MDFYPIDSIESTIDCNQFVYHYTTCKVALEFILLNRTLRFSPFCQVNDPKDYKSRTLSLLLKTQEDDEFYNKEVLNISSKWHNLFVNNSKLLCFSCDNPLINKSSEETKDFFRGCCKPRMWAQYGDKHSGICLKFDRKKLSKYMREHLSNKGEIIESKVKYSNSLDEYYHALQVDLDDLRNYSFEDYLINYHIKKHSKELFFLKTLDWRDETEYRWVLIGRDKGYIEFPFMDSLEDIIVGGDFPSVYLPSLKELNKEVKAHVKRVNWLDGRPKVFKFDYD